MHMLPTTSAGTHQQSRLCAFAAHSTPTGAVQHNIPCNTTCLCFEHHGISADVVLSDAMDRTGDNLPAYHQAKGPDCLHSQATHIWTHARLNSNRYQLLHASAAAAETALSTKQTAAVSGDGAATHTSFPIAVKTPSTSLFTEGHTRHARQHLHALPDAVTWC
jgi:hypothetical protein